jgi:hypothetical protein
MSPAQHRRECGPFCTHTLFCRRCVAVFGLCDRHGPDPDAGVYWSEARCESEVSPDERAKP